MKYFDLLSMKENKKWTTLLWELPNDQQDIYTTPEYYRLYEEMGDGKALCFAFKKNGYVALYPFLINAVNNSKYNLDKIYYDIQGAYGYNGVISSTYDTEFINEFYFEFNQWCKEMNIVAEFTRMNPYLKNHNFSKDYLELILNRKTVVLDLNNSIENIWQNYISSKTRNMVRKALKNKNSVVIDNSLQGATHFYKMYKDNMIRIEADPYYLFKEDMFLNMLKNSQFNFLFVEDEFNNRIATMILVVYKRYAHYYLSGRDIFKANNSVNSFLLYEAIKIARERGAEIFHFGGGNSLDENDPLFKFKKGFSRSYLDFFIGKKIHNKIIYDVIRKQWKKNHPASYFKNKDMILGYRKI